MANESAYEFTPEQNTSFSRLGYKMKGVGAAFVVMGLMCLLVGGLMAMGVYKLVHSPDPAVMEKIKVEPPILFSIAGMYGVAGLVYLAIGFWTRSSGNAFRAIVATRGNDIGLLLQAIDTQHKMYSLLYTVILIGMLVFVGLMIFGIVGKSMTG
jgi:hypothetical protein